MLAGVIAVAVFHLSEELGGPAMLYALLIGMAFNFLAENPRLESGIAFASKTILRIGVALLGARIVVDDLLQIGGVTVGLVLAGVVVTIVAGKGIGQFLGLNKHHALMSAGAVAICGASAALAISSVLPSTKEKERETILTVALVTSISTLAMIVYPLVTRLLGLDNETAGVFIGATIHDVAQVVGAGYMVSEQTGDISTIVKLLRVACLVPLILSLAMLSRLGGPSAQAKTPLIPTFLAVFVIIVAANSNGFIPPEISVHLSTIASWCLLTAVAALGLKTDLGALLEFGPRPLIAMTLQTLVLALFILTGLMATIGHS